MDYLDGKMNPEETAMLMVFLAKNPDLQDELDEMESVTLPITEETFPNKENLKKTSITGSSFQDLCIANLEGDLNEREEEYFNELIEKDSKREKEYTIYKKTKLQPDLNIVFPNKKILKKKQYKIGRIIYPVLAAAAIFLLMLFVYNLNQDHTTPDQSAQIIVDKTQKTSQIALNSKTGLIDSTSATFNYSPINPDNQKKQKENTKEKQKSQKQINANNKKGKIKHESIALLDSRNTCLNIHDESKLAIQEKQIEISAIELPKDKKQENNAKQQSFMSVKEFIAANIKEKVFRKNADEKIDMVDIANLTLRGINKIASSDMNLSWKESNDNAEILAFSSDKVQFGTKMRKK
ncbi:MAG: hypothetical protein C0594_16820 [Marinilabiliales bacterium]|nr:MAG: hypothetical protein C0594_16820 [Marinilabiliales bacterium]